MMKKNKTELAHILGSGGFSGYVLEAIGGMDKDALMLLTFNELMQASPLQICEIYESVGFRGFRGFVVDGTIDRGFGYKVCLRDGSWVLIYSDRDGNNELGVYASPSVARLAFVVLVYEGAKKVFQEIRDKRLRELS
jgi:hypothetical protein